MQEPFIQYPNSPANNSINPYTPNNSEFPNNQMNNNPYNVPPGPNPYAPSQTAKAFPVPPVMNPYDQAKANNYNQNDNFADNLNKLHQKQRVIHCRALTATIFLIIGVTVGLVLLLAGNPPIAQNDFIIIECASYVLYLLIACCCNKLVAYLSNIDVGQNFQGYYDSVRAMVGHFTFHAQCYHFETRHHTRYYKDADGNQRVEHYTTQEKVVTHTATENLHPYETKDESGQIDRIRSDTNIVFIHFHVNYRFFDSISSSNFQRTYQSFKCRNTRDVHQNFSMGYSVPGLIERKAFYVGSLDCEFKTWFYVFTFFGLAWPYSLWVESKITRFDVNTMKVLKV